MASMQENQIIKVINNPPSRADSPGFGEPVMYRDAEGKAKFVSADNPLPVNATLDVGDISIDNLEISQEDSSILIYGFDGVANQPISVDENGVVNIAGAVTTDVDLSVLEAVDFATETTLLSIDGKITTCDTDDVTVSSTPAVDNAVDNILVYGYDGTDNQPLATDSSGNVILSDLTLTTTNLDGVTTATNGSSVDTSVYSKKTVYVVVSGNTGAVTVTIEHSPNGTDWFEYESKTYTSTNANDSWSSSDYFPYMRVTTTTQSDSTVTAIIVGKKL
jgi:hypothetical protein